MFIINLLLKAFLSDWFREKLVWLIYEFTARKQITFTGWFILLCATGKNKSIPAIRCFSPSPVDEYKLSVDHAENTITPEISLSRVGATLKKDGAYKNINDFEIYSLNVGEISLIPGVLDVVADPIVNDPEIPGVPDNPSHSLIHISDSMEEEMQPEIYAKTKR